MIILQSNFLILFEQFQHLSDQGEEIILVQISLIGRIEPLHDFFDFFFGRFLNVHFLSSHGQYFLEFVPLNAAIIVDVDHIEGSFIDTAKFLLILHQFFPHII